MATESTSKESVKGLIDAHLVEAILVERQSFVAKKLCEILDYSDCDTAAAKQIASFLERFSNPIFARDIIEHGITVENPEVQRVFADQVGWLAKIDWKDGYVVIGKLVKTEATTDPDQDLVVIALRSIRQDAPREVFDAIVDRGTKEQRDPEKQQRTEPFQERLRVALSRLGR